MLPNDPNELIGKFVAFDNEYGACWAKIKSVAQSGRSTILITEKLIVRHAASKINEYREPRVLFFDAVKEKGMMFGEPLSEEAKDFLMLGYLSDSNLENEKSSCELGKNDIQRLM